MPILHTLDFPDPLERRLSVTYAHQTVPRSGSMLPSSKERYSSTLLRHCFDKPRRRALPQPLAARLAAYAMR